MLHQLLYAKFLWSTDTGVCWPSEWLGHSWGWLPVCFELPFKDVSLFVSVCSSLVNPLFVKLWGISGGKFFNLYKWVFLGGSAWILLSRVNARNYHESKENTWDGRGDSMAGDVEREERGRNGRSDEENETVCYQLSAQCRLCFLISSAAADPSSHRKGCRASFQRTGVSDNTECVLFVRIQIEAQVCLLLLECF